LIDGNLADRLVESLAPTRSDTVLEIGPGTGSLTKRLIQVAGHVVAIESDRLLAEHLRQSLSDLSRVTLVEDDFLGVDLSRLMNPAIRGSADSQTPPRPPLLISNLPYSITSPALLKIITSPVRFERIVLTVQREVAQRLMAQPGTKEYGRLSVVMRLALVVSTLFDLSPRAFRPRPKVVSRALLARPIAEADFTSYLGSWLEKVIQSAFGTRRKQVAKSLTLGLHLTRSRVDRALERVGIPSTARAEEIAPADYPRLADALDASSTEPGERA
jgi:16S rRNA (adenine1518-N6/adenine1519-N6)-dimethyltransferase